MKPRRSAVVQRTIRCLVLVPYYHQSQSLQLLGAVKVCVCVAQMCFVCVLVPFVRVMKKHNFRSSPSPRLPLTWLQPPCHWQQSPGLQCLKCTAVAACTVPYLPPPPTHSLYIFCPSTTTLELFYMHSKLNLIAQQPYGLQM